MLGDVKCAYEHNLRLGNEVAGEIWVCEVWWVSSPTPNSRELPNDVSSAGVADPT